MSQFTRIGPFHPGIRNSTTLFPSYYLPTNQTPSTNTGVATAGRAYGALFEDMAGAVTNRLGMEVITGAAGGARLGLYSHDHTTGHWGPLLIDGGALDTTNIALIEAAIAALTCPEKFWIVSLFEAGPTMRIANQDNTTRFGNSTPSGASAGRGLITVQAYGALPATLPAPSAYSGNTPAMWLRYV